MSRERRQDGIRERRRLENIRSLKQVAAVMSVLSSKRGHRYCNKVIIYRAIHRR